MAIPESKQTDDVTKKQIDIINGNLPIDVLKVRQSCSSRTFHHIKSSTEDILSSLAELVKKGRQPSLERGQGESSTASNKLKDVDFYGRGAIIEDFEHEMAEIFGKEAAVFMPSGTMCQQIALRVWVDNGGASGSLKSRDVGFHPQSHLQKHEQMAYQQVQGLKAVLIGKEDAMMTLLELQEAVKRQPIAALLVELPQREIFFQLPPWEELVKLCEWARGQGIALHCDGARVWECLGFYKKSLKEIASLFDSFYVSMYKGLGALSGAVLLGSSSFIAESKIWQRRLGGNLVYLFPNVLSAMQGLDENFYGRSSSTIPLNGGFSAPYGYYQKALELAKGLSQVPGITVFPNPPQSTSFGVFFEGDYDRIVRATAVVSQEADLLVFPFLQKNRGPPPLSSSTSKSAPAVVKEEEDASAVTAVEGGVVVIADKEKSQDCIHGLEFVVGSATMQTDTQLFFSLARKIMELSSEASRESEERAKGHVESHADQDKSTVTIAS